MANVALIITEKGMQLSVPKGTALIFNLSSTSSQKEHLDQMQDVQFHKGSILFQTVVVNHLSYIFLNLHSSFQFVAPHENTIQDTEGLEFKTLKVLNSRHWRSWILNSISWSSTTVLRPVQQVWLHCMFASSKCSTCPLNNCSCTSKSSVMLSDAWCAGGGAGGRIPTGPKLWSCFFGI